MLSKPLPNTCSYLPLLSTRAPWTQVLTFLALQELLSVETCSTWDCSAHEGQQSHITVTCSPLC